LRLIGTTIQNHALPGRFLLRDLKQDMGNLLRGPITFPNKLIEQPGRKGSNWATIAHIRQNLEHVRSKNKSKE
jgi:hypothetical protein